MRTGSLDMTITRETGVVEQGQVEEYDVVVTIEYELDAYGCRVGLHRDDRVYGPLTRAEEERAIDLAREDALGD